MRTCDGLSLFSFFPLFLSCSIMTVRIRDIDYLGYRRLFESIASNSELKRLVLFKKFNQKKKYPTIVDYCRSAQVCENIPRTPALTISRIVAVSSLELKHLSESFIADANYYFLTLTSLVLTSRLFTPDESSAETRAMLQVGSGGSGHKDDHLGKHMEIGHTATGCR